MVAAQVATPMPELKLQIRNLNSLMLLAKVCTDAARFIGRWNFLKFSQAVGLMCSWEIPRSWAERSWKPPSVATIAP